MVPWWGGKGYLAWCEARERFQLSAIDIELIFLGNIYVGHEWGSKSCFERVCKLIMRNAKTKFLMVKRVVYGWLGSIYKLKICKKKKKMGGKGMVEASGYVLNMAEWPKVLTYKN